MLSHVDAHATTVLVAVEPRLLHEALCIALRARDDLDVLDTDDLLPGDHLDAAIVTGHVPVGVVPDVILELPDQDHWKGTASLLTGDDHRAVAVPTLDAVATVLADAISTAQSRHAAAPAGAGRTGRTRGQAARRGRSRRFVPLAVGASVLLSAGTAAAATGSLPAPAQREVAELLTHVGVHVPEPDSGTESPGGANGTVAPGSTVAPGGPPIGSTTPPASGSNRPGGDAGGQPASANGNGSGASDGHDNGAHGTPSTSRGNGQPGQGPSGNGGDDGANNGKGSSGSTPATTRPTSRTSPTPPTDGGRSDTRGAATHP